MRRTIISIIVLGMLFVTCNAYAIVVNGSLDDWGVTPAGYGSSQWVPFGGIIYTVEDQNVYRLVPGYGGQPFDAEAIYYTTDTSNIYLAIVTGHPATGLKIGGIQYYPGDIYFNYGVGRRYGLETMGINAGQVYRNPLWNGSPYWGGVTDPTSMQDGTGTLMGSSSFVYAHSYYGSGDSNDHWVMEMSIPKSFFGSDWADEGTIHWTQTCGNDAIDLNVPHSPEPANLSLVGLGLFGFLRFRKKKVF